MIANGIGLALEDIAIIQNNIGSTFGYKFSPTNEGLLGVAAMATNRPVYLEYDMYQQITYTRKRSPVFINLKMGPDKNGKIKAMRSDWTIDHGPYSEFGDLLTMRAYGSPQSLFASEISVDQLAEKMGMDPLEFRYRNVYREGSTTFTGCEPDVICLPSMTDTMRPHYEKAKEKVNKKNDNDFKESKVNTPSGSLYLE